MPPLPNAKHELFAQELARGTPTPEAYVKAGYADNKGNASTLKHKQNVSKRVAEILGGARRYS
jgi:phage terminase small subunit